MTAEEAIRRRDAEWYCPPADEPLAGVFLHTRSTSHPPSEDVQMAVSDRRALLALLDARRTEAIEGYLVSDEFRERLAAALYIANAAAVPDDSRWRARLRRRAAMYQYVLASAEHKAAAEMNLDMAAEMITDLLPLDGPRARQRERYDEMRDYATRILDEVWAGWERARGDGSATPSERLTGVLAKMRDGWLR